LFDKGAQGSQRSSRSVIAATFAAVALAMLLQAGLRASPAAAAVEGHFCWEKNLGPVHHVEPAWYCEEIQTAQLHMFAVHAWSESTAICLHQGLTGKNEVCGPAGQWITLELRGSNNEGQPSYPQIENQSGSKYTRVKGIVVHAGGGEGGGGESGGGGGGGGGGGESPPPPPPPVESIAFSSYNTEHLFTWRTGVGAVETNLGLAAHTSPSIATHAGGNFEVAFNANGTNKLWTYVAGGPSEHNLFLEPSSSPAIAALEGGGYEIAFVGQGSHHLWVYNTNSNVATDTGIGVAEHSDPAITALPGGGYAVAVSGYGSNELWTYSPSRGEYAHHGLGVQPNTSPSITAADGGFVVAFSGMGSKELWTYSTANGGVNHHNGLATASGPSIASTNLGYSIGINSLNTELFGVLRAENGSESFSTSGIGMAPGSSPSLASDGTGSYTSAFAVPSHFLWTLRPFVGVTNLGVGIATGTDPSVAYG
jgi:hypothetical protein